MSESPLVQAWKSGADNLLVRLSEQTEDVIDDVCAETWPAGEEDWWENAGDNGPERTAHSERTYAYVLRFLVPLLEGAANAAIERSVVLGIEA